MILNYYLVMGSHTLGAKGYVFPLEEGNYMKLWPWGAKRQEGKHDLWSHKY